MARFCPSPDCDGYMIAENMDARKLECPKCARAICFRCKEEWHGYFTSCESAMEKAFEGWGDGADRIIFCPMCRTKIQKTEGCNHMTCLFCKYEFCYYCGGYAGPDSNHFSAGFGCGASQFGDSFQRNFITTILCKILWVLVIILAAPFILVLAPPILFTVGWIKCWC